MMFVTCINFTTYADMFLQSQFCSIQAYESLKRRIRKWVKQSVLYHPITSNFRIQEMRSQHRPLETMTYNLQSQGSVRAMKDLY